MKRTPLVRKTRLRPVRSTPRRNEPSPAMIACLRAEVYQRAGGRCELRLSPSCIQGVLPYTSDSMFTHGHLVHLHARRRFGWDLDNLRWGCWQCHLIELHQGGKPCPKKPPMESL
jgi:hypothetical protein